MAEQKDDSFEIFDLRVEVVAPEGAAIYCGAKVGDQWLGSRVISGGEVRIVMQHYTRMDPDLAPDWPRGDGWTIEIEGEPSVRARIDVGIHGEVHTDQGCLATAMHAIHAVPYVVSAGSGILSLADVPPAWGGDAFHIRQ